MQVIRSIEELDAKIEECNRAEAQSDDAMRAVFGSFRMDPPGGLPPDPFSESYRQAQLALYRDVAGRAYDTANEVTAFDIERRAPPPLPLLHRQRGDHRRTADGGRLADPRHGAAAGLAHRRIRPGLGQHHAGARPARPPRHGGGYRAAFLRAAAPPRRAGRRRDRGGERRLPLGRALRPALRRRAVLRMLPPLRRPPAPAARAAGSGGAGRPRLLRRRADHPRFPDALGVAARRQFALGDPQERLAGARLPRRLFCGCAGRMRLVRAAPGLRRSRPG